MMPARVTLTVIQGKLTGKTFVFEERTSCIIGRAEDCDPRIPEDEHHRTISRHHCLLDINPPDIRVRDFGSRNGTYVNNAKIGQRAKDQTPEKAAQGSFPEHDLKEGDEIKLGETVLCVSLFIPILCAECSVEIPEDQKGRAERAPGVYQCEACRHKASQAQQQELPRPRPKVCAGCGKDVSREPGKQEQGDYLCAACRKDPQQLIKALLELARRGNRPLQAIQDYSLLRELGHGGMGAVYLVRHNRTGEHLALKVMLPQIATREPIKARFLQEIEHTKALKHPHIVQLRDSGYAQGTFFFTLEYCDGGSADKLIKVRGGALPIDEASELILQALDGLHYAHTEHGLVHRDVKPANLFLVGSGRSRITKVGDYGLAKAFDSAGLSGQTRTGEVMGTPVFTPRQQVINFKYARPEVDVWAMAASLYYLLTSAFPRDFTKGKDPWLIVLQTNAIPIRQRNAAIPKKLAEVIDHALVDHPQIGFKTVVEFKQALERAL
jgi:serine/threonine-protein kinase